MKNYELKREILLSKTELLKDLSKAQFLDYACKSIVNDGVIVSDNKWHDLEHALTLEEVCEKYGVEYVVSANQLLYANKKRKLHLRDRISNIIEDALNRGLKVYFGTFTFSDELIAKTNEETRRQYIQRTLKESGCIHYVANKDFGVDERYTQREHYHAVFSCPDISKVHQVYKSKTNSHLWVETIKLYANYKKTNIKLAKYITKLSNHAIKESATYKRVCYIFDRNKEYILS